MASVPFCQMIRSSGLAEPWTHESEKNKFTQFGWRCTTKESSFGNNTLIGNWNEDRFDVKEVLRPCPLPSKYDHYFESSYRNSCSVPATNPADGVKNLRRQPPCSFPGHQPAFDTAEAQSTYNSWATSYRSAYGNGLVPASHGSAVADASSLRVSSDGGNVQQLQPLHIAHLAARAGHPAPGNSIVSSPHPGPGATAPSAQ